MQSRTSFFDKTLFKNDMSRFWPIWVSYLVIWVFVLPISLFIGAADKSVVDDMVGQSVSAMLIVSYPYALASAMAMLSHLYQSRSANFYGSLPVRREGQFITQYISGLLFTIGPNIVVAALTYLASLGVGGMDVKVLMMWLLVSCCFCFFFYSLAMFSGMLVGHMVALPGFYVLFIFIFSALYELIGMIIRSYYWGFDRLPDALTDLVAWFAPFTKLRHVGIYTDGSVRPVESDIIMPHLNRGDVVLVYYLAGLALTVAAFLLHRSRRLESAGDPVAVKPVRPIVKYVLAVTVGLAMGIVTAELLDAEKLLGVFCVIWAMIGAFGVQMVLDKSFKVFKKWKGTAVLCAVMALVLLGMDLDITGFEDRVPDPEDVESMEVMGFTTPFNSGEIETFHDFETTDRGEIEEFVALNRELVKLKGDSSIGNLYLNVRYHTKSGEIRRSYTVSLKGQNDQEIVKAISNIFEDRDLYWKIYGFDKADPGTMYEAVYRNYSTSEGDPEYGVGVQPGDEATGVTGDFPVDGYVEATFLRPGDRNDIYSAVLEDFRDGNIGVRSVDSSAQDPDNDPQRHLEFYFVGMDDGSGYVTPDEIIYISVPDTAVKTLAALKNAMPHVVEDGSVYGSLYK